MPALRHLLPTLALLALVLVSAGCREEPSGPDLTNPRSAAVTFTSALEVGDVATARLASNASGMEMDLLEAMAQSATGATRLRTAAVARFGNDANRILQHQSLNVSQNLASGEVSAGEHVAAVRSKDGRDHVQLLKVDGLWRVDVGALIRGKDLSNIVPFFHAAGVATRQIADEIEAGKITTVEQAQEEITRRLAALLPQMIHRQYEASTRPAVDIPSL